MATASRASPRPAAGDGTAGRRPAGVLLIVTSLLWLHDWLPLLAVAALAAWLAVHERLEGDLGAALVRYWRRAWPPRTAPLALGLAASGLAYWVLVPLPARLLPVGLDALGLALLLRGAWRARSGAAAAARVAPA